MDVFKLDSSKLNEILYNMENQNKDAFVVISSGEILYDDEVTPDNYDSNNTYPLPKWGPVEGFRIMNDFVSGLKNLILKDELVIVLNSGHGVFRKFKNTLKSSPDIQKMWYNFKKEQIKSKVLNWYNQIREYAGLESLTQDDLEDDQDLLNFDFNITDGCSIDLEYILDSDKKGFNELYSHYPKVVIDEIYLKKRDEMLNLTMFEADFITVAKTPLGDNAGFVWATGYTLCDSFSGMELLQLYVEPEFRGLGIGKMLLNRVLTQFKDGDFKDFTVNCQGESSWLIHFLELEGYKIAFQELSFRP
ncbi:MAG: GNAT family N-acetyltransferase [Spirochaetaceae bacterium]